MLAVGLITYHKEIEVAVRCLELLSCQLLWTKVKQDSAIRDTARRIRLKLQVSRQLHRNPEIALIH